MASINPACVDSLSGVLEYVSSTGRVRNRHPAVGKIARTNAKVQKGALRLMKYQMTPRPFEYSAPKRVQNQRILGLREQAWLWAKASTLRDRCHLVGVLLKSVPLSVDHHLNCGHSAQDRLAHPYYDLRSRRLVCLGSSHSHRASRANLCNAASRLLDAPHRLRTQERRSDSQ